MGTNGRGTSLSYNVQDYGPQGVPVEFQDMLRCAVAHVRLLRSFRSLLQPPSGIEGASEAVFGTQKALSGSFAGRSYSSSFSQATGYSRVVLLGQWSFW